LLTALIAYYLDLGWCDQAEVLLKSIQSGGANRATNVNATQAQREKRRRDLVPRLRASADRYQRELAATKAEHSDALAARQAFGVVLRQQQCLTGAAYQLKAVLDARVRLMGEEHVDTQVCGLELGRVRLQQKKYADAEKLLLEAYLGLK